MWSGGLGPEGLEAENSEAWVFPLSDCQRENASPAPGTTAEEAMSRGPPPAPEGGSRDEQDGASADTEPWAAAVPPVSVRRWSSGLSKAAESCGNDYFFNLFLPRNGFLLSSRTFTASGR